VAFARHTSGRIVAEGIETDGEYATLMELGVEKGQGFMLGRPMRMSELLGRLARAA
jgi:EAL domain-containing protein (putative c-di-GMP-specific phosphodiesterase class I)